MKKAIITTPTDLKLTYLIVKYKNEKLNDILAYKVLNTPNKHLYIEYDETNENMLKVLIDLDSYGLSHIKKVEELEKYFNYKPYQGELK